jgi:hypothetical protein
MSNTLTGGRENKISRAIQAIKRKSLIMVKVASFKEEESLVKGQSVNRPIYSDVTVTDYVANTDITAQDITATQELLTVNISKAARVKTDPVEQKQIELGDKIDMVYASRIASALKQEAEGKFLQEISNASVTIDAGNFGGTAGTPIDLSTVNVERVFSDNYATLATLDVEMNSPWQAVVDQFVISNIEQRSVATRFATGDTTFKNGYKGDFMGFEVYTSNSLPASVSLALGTQPTDGDYIKINNVTFTFKTTLGATAGNVLIGASAATALAALVAAVNGAAGAGSTYVALSTKNRVALTHANVVAVNNTTAMGLTSYGRMRLVESLTAVADVFGTQTLKCLFQRKGAIDAVMQMQPTIQINKAEGNAGHSILGIDLYGFKTFTEGAERMLRVDIKG